MTIKSRTEFVGLTIEPTRAHLTTVTIFVDDDDKEVGRTQPQTQIIAITDDMAELQVDDRIAMAITCIWHGTIDQAVRAHYEKVTATHKEHQTRIDDLIAHASNALGTLDQSHKLLDEEHATFAERHEFVSKQRQALFDDHQKILKQRPQVDKMIEALGAELAPTAKAPGEMPVRRPA